MDRDNPLVSIIVRTKDRPKLFQGDILRVAQSTMRSDLVILHSGEWRNLKRLFAKW